jgi:hypothetical protein
VFVCYILAMLGLLAATAVLIVAGGRVVAPARRLAANGVDAWAQVLARGYEGYVVKDEASPYRAGVTRSWLKVKVPGWTVEGDGWQRAKL